MEPLIPLDTDAKLDDVRSSDIAIVFKHSSFCGTSSQALRELKKFIADRPEVPVYLVNVVANRAMSRRLEELWGVKHESPQAFVISGGRPRWSASHLDITRDVIAHEVREAEGDREAASVAG